MLHLCYVIRNARTYIKNRKLRSGCLFGSLHRNAKTLISIRSCCVYLNPISILTFDTVRTGKETETKREKKNDRIQEDRVQSEAKRNIEEKR